MSGYPDLRRSVTGEWPPRITSIPVGQPILGEDLYGPKHQGLVYGWLEPPASWSPESLLWRPEGVKALDVAGEVIDVETFPSIEGRAWITSQLRLRDRWLAAIRSRILDGRLKLTAALSELLDMAFDDGALLASDPARVMATGPLASELAAERRRFIEQGGRLN